MEIKFTKTEEKVMEILFSLYLRGYSFADALDILNGTTLNSILARRIKEDISRTNKHMKSTIGICEHSEDEYLCILNSKIENNTENLILELTAILTILGKIKSPSKTTKDLYGKLKSDIKEIKSIITDTCPKITTPENLKTDSCFYQMLQSLSIKQLRKAKLDGEMLKG